MMKDRWLSAGNFLATALLVAQVAVAAASSSTEDVPEGVNMLLPRGAIPAVFDPVFVSADSADIPDGAWVLGVEIDGTAHAYSLNLLNHHEIVNDRFGKLPVAAVW